MNTKHDFRFTRPLYTSAEAARLVGVPTSTFVSWAKGYVRRQSNGRVVQGAAIVTSIDAVAPMPSIPFVGLAEGLVLAAVRESGVPLQRVRPALDALAKELGVEHALATKRLYTDGAEILFDYSSTGRRSGAAEVGELVVVRNNQRVFSEVVQRYLRRLEYSNDGYARLVRPPAYKLADVVCDPDRSFGRPIFAKGAVRVDDVLGRFDAGESLVDLSADFGVPIAELEDALRVASRRAA
ncbi:MAG: DUF433 domain-containing protein [Acidimicrobiales bacterium]